jgi:hypothetical protein
VYPNPTSDLLFVPKQFLGESYQLVNMFGQILDFGKLETTLDVSSLANGVYLLNVVSKEGNTATRFLKK